MKTAIVGIGTNIGDRRRNVESAIEALKHLPNTEIAAVSPIYETEPWGYTEQNRFYNVCVKISTELSPSALLGACLGIEAAFGRERPFKNSPRIIDIDLLLYEEAELNTPELTLPHPRMRERTFVLVPLKDVLTDLKFGGYDFNEDLEKCDKNAVKKL